MAREAHRQAHRRETGLADIGRVGVAEPPSAPAGLARRLERVAEIDAFADRQGDSGGGASGRRRRHGLPGRRIGGGRTSRAEDGQRSIASANLLVPPRINVLPISVSQKGLELC
jgi:hypothetical protein